MTSDEIRAEIERLQAKGRETLDMVAILAIGEQIRALRVKLWKSGECCGAPFGERGCGSLAVAWLRDKDAFICDRRKA